MVFIKEESEDLKIEETFRVKHETAKQRKKEESEDVKTEETLRVKHEDVKIEERFRVKREETEEQTKKEESEDVKIEETLRVKHEDIKTEERFRVKREETEEQTDVAGHSAPHIWIVGSSIVHRLDAYICEHNLDRNLGLHAKITWEGKGERCWEHLLPVLRALCAKGPAPGVLVIHLGGNGLCQEGRNRLDLFREMKSDLAEIFRLFPETRILFSDILPRLNWRGQTGKKAYRIERSRRWLNKALSDFLAERRMSCVRHQNIGVSHLCRDGVHLSPEGNEILWSNLTEALQVELRK